MKRQNKRGVLSYFFGIMIFFLISIVGIAGTYFYFAVGNDYLILNLYNASTTANNSALIDAGFEEVVTNYQNTSLGFIDNVWLFSYMFISIIGFSGAYFSRSMNYYSWLSMLTYGLMFFLFILGLFLIIINWLYRDILLNLFDNLAVNLPKFAFVLDNLGLIFLLQASIMLLLNVVDFDFAFIMGRKSKEQKTLTQDDDLV